MEIDYYAKYLKYKNKYLELKEQLGGANDKCSKLKKEDQCNENVSCKWADYYKDGNLKGKKCREKFCNEFTALQCPEEAYDIECYNKKEVGALTRDITYSCAEKKYR